MTDRQKQITEFLTRHGWGEAERHSLADDASFRRYERLVRGSETAVLMDAPPQFEDVQPFVAVAGHLRNIGLAAPEIYAGDMDRGFLLLEDMGDGLFARIMTDDPGQEQELYHLAVDGLLHLHKFPVPENFPRYDIRLLLGELSLFVDWYLPGRSGNFLTDRQREAFLALWREILAPVMEQTACLSLRDYHAENLMLRQNPGKGDDPLLRLGLLDFQDAAAGHPAYDLVSLLQDARRDVSREMEQEMLGCYIDRTGMDEENFRRDYAILGVQRNLKVMGIFTRLYMRDGKAGYLDKIPRVQAALERGLAHPALEGVKAWLGDHAMLEISDVRPLPFMPKKAMILAAGPGSRMRPLTDNCPKPLLKVAGRELLSWSLDGLCAAGVRDVVINSHYLADQMTDFIHHYHDPRLRLTLSDERAELQGSGGGVRKALEHLGDDPFFVLNSDMIWRDGSRQMLQRMRAFWQPDRMDILMLLIARSKACGYDGAGDYHRDEAGRLVGRGKKNQGKKDHGTKTRADYVYGGILIIKPECFRDAPDGPFSLHRQFDSGEKSGRLSGVIHDGQWYHVGTPPMREAVEKILTHAQTIEKST